MKTWIFFCIWGMLSLLGLTIYPKSTLLALKFKIDICMGLIGWVLVLIFISSMIGFIISF